MTMHVRIRFSKKKMIIWLGMMFVKGWLLSSLSSIQTHSLKVKPRPSLETLKWLRLPIVSSVKLWVASSWKILLSLRRLLKKGFWLLRPVSPLSVPVKWHVRSQVLKFLTFQGSWQTVHRIMPKWTNFSLSKGTQPVVLLNQVVTVNSKLFCQFEVRFWTLKRLAWIRF